MDRVRVGLALRSLRRRKGLRQVDVAATAGVDQSTISLVERGHRDRLALHTLERIFAVVDARFVGDVRWRGGQLERLLDERHARLVGIAAGRLARAGWEVTVEATFAHYGERGSIDILATRRAPAVALVVEGECGSCATQDEGPVSPAFLGGRGCARELEHGSRARSAGAGR